MPLPSAPPRNFILRNLPAPEWEVVGPRLQAVDLPTGTLLQEESQPIEYAYFMETGLASVVVPLLDGSSVETAMVGREGVVSPEAAAVAKKANTRSVAQIGGTALRITGRDLVSSVDTCRELRKRLTTYSAYAFSTAAQSAACNAVHEVGPRLGRWLMMVRMHTGLEELPLTQDYIAQMLAVRRPSVTSAALALQAANLISYSRGRIRITDETGLRDAACECFEAIRSVYADYLQRD